MIVIRNVSQSNVTAPSALRLDRRGVFELFPLKIGHGHTIGHAFRRAAMSDTISCSIVAIKIEGINHEFASVHGMREDLISVISTLRAMPIRIRESQFDDIITLSLHCDNSKRLVTCKDLPASHQIEFPEQDYKLFELTGTNAVEIKIWFACGISEDSGEKFFTRDPLQMSAEYNNILSEHGVIRIMPNFSKCNVGVQIEPIDKGGITFDLLRLTIDSSSGQSPTQIFNNTRAILADWFDAIRNIQFSTNDDDLGQVRSATLVKVLNKSLNSHDIVLNAAILNSLEAAEFFIIEDLVNATSLISIPGMSLDVIERIRSALKLVHPDLELNSQVLKEYGL